MKTNLILATTLAFVGFTPTAVVAESEKQRRGLFARLTSQSDTDAGAKVNSETARPKSQSPLKGLFRKRNEATSVTAKSASVRQINRVRMRQIKRSRGQAQTARSTSRTLKTTGRIRAKITPRTGLFQRLSQTSISRDKTRGIAGVPKVSPLRSRQSTLTVRTTAYTHSESDHLKYGRKTALGTTLRSSSKYTSAAADWSRFPPGTTFKIAGNQTTYVVDDYGSALVGTNTIDLYKPSRSSMNRWGARNVSIKILKVGCFDHARQHLSKLKDYWHCRLMLNTLG